MNRKLQLGAFVVGGGVFIASTLLMVGCSDPKHIVLNGKFNQNYNPLQNDTLIVNNDKTLLGWLDLYLNNEKIKKHLSEDINSTLYDIVFIELIFVHINTWHINWHLNWNINKNTFNFNYSIEIDDKTIPDNSAINVNTKSINVKLNHYKLHLFSVDKLLSEHFSFHFTPDNNFTDAHCREYVVLKDGSIIDDAFSQKQWYFSSTWLSMAVDFINPEKCITLPSDSQAAQFKIENRMEATDLANFMVKWHDTSTTIDQKVSCLSSVSGFEYTHNNDNLQWWEFVKFALVSPNEEDQTIDIDFFPMKGCNFIADGNEAVSFELRVPYIQNP